MKPKKGIQWLIRIGSVTLISIVTGQIAAINTNASDQHVDTSQAQNAQNLQPSSPFGNTDGNSNNNGDFRQDPSQNNDQLPSFGDPQFGVRTHSRSGGS